MTTPTDLDGRVLGIIRKYPYRSMRRVTLILNSENGCSYEYDEVEIIINRLINEGKVKRDTENSDRLYAV